MIRTTHACVSTSQVTQITFSILFPQVRPKNLTLERQQLKNTRNVSTNNVNLELRRFASFWHNTFTWVFKVSPVLCIVLEAFTAFFAGVLINVCVFQVV